MTVAEDVAVENISVSSKIDYQVNEAELSENSNTLTLPIINNVITLEKTSDASAVISGQTLLYQNVIKNEGSVTITNLFFTDPITEGTTFVEGSVKIDDVEQPDYDPATGFALDDIDPNGSVKITFEVTIN